MVYWVEIDENEFKELTLKAATSQNVKKVKVSKYFLNALYMFVFLF